MTLRHLTKSCYSNPDPFLWQSPKSGEEQCYLESLNTLEYNHDYTDTFLLDQYCPSSEPSSPGSTYSNSNLYAAQTGVKQEPPHSLFFHGEPEFPFASVSAFISQASADPLHDLDDVVCDIPAGYLPVSGDLINFDFDSTEQFFLDTLLPAAAFSLESVMENGMEDSTDPVDSIPPPLPVPPTKSKARVSARPKRTTPPTQAPLAMSPASSSGSLDAIQQWKRNSAPFAKTPSRSSRDSSLASGFEDAASSSKSSKQQRNTDGKRSPTAYADRRRKNNIAVRKSREKKRQEITKFTQEHMNLQRQCDQLRASNEKLVRALNDVQEALVEDKTPGMVKSILAAAKKQLNLP